jgi:hypothetical protein
LVHGALMRDCTERSDLVRQFAGQAEGFHRLSRLDTMDGIPNYETA